MRFTLRRSLVAGVGAAALLGGALIAPNLAGAQVTASFTLSPSSATAGETVTFAVTGCFLEGVESPLFAIDMNENTFATDIAVDADGAGSYQFTIPSAADMEPDSYTFSASCYDPENPETIGFTYEETPVLTITAAAPTTTSTTAAPTTTAPAAAAAATVNPSFTG